MPYVSDGAASGTTGQSLRLEAVKIHLTNQTAIAHINYSVHLQNAGWVSSVGDDSIAGTVGQSIRMEAIKITLDGMPGFSVEYRVHVQGIGWMDWHKDGETAGTTGQGLRLEAIEIKIVENVYNVISLAPLNVTVTALNPGIQLDKVNTPLESLQENQRLVYIDQTGNSVVVTAPLSYLNSYLLAGYTSTTHKWIALVVDTGESSILGVYYNGAALISQDVDNAASFGVGAGKFLIWIDADQIASAPQPFVLSEAGRANTTITISFDDNSDNVF